MKIDEIINVMVSYEMNASAPKDGRRIIANERCNLMAAQQTGTLTQDQIDEAAKVLDMWASYR